MSDVLLDFSSLHSVWIDYPDVQSGESLSGYLCNKTILTCAELRFVIFICNVTLV